MAKRKLEAYLDSESTIFHSYQDLFPTPQRLKIAEIKLSLSCIPDEILALILCFLGPSLDLLELERSGKIPFGPILQRIWKYFFSQRFECMSVVDTLASTSRVDSWKLRYFANEKSILLLRSCRSTNAIRTVTKTSIDDELFYFNIRFGSEVQAVYAEILVGDNCDNLSLSLVDFDAGGRSSVTFNPETGVVIKEKRVIHSPGRVEGLYCFALKPIVSIPSPARRFTGNVGVLVYDGKIAFTRRCAASMIWETTHFCASVDWLDAGLITPCVAFRDKGAYTVKISRVGPDCPAKVNNATDGGPFWNRIDWEDSDAERQ